MLLLQLVTSRYRYDIYGSRETRANIATGEKTSTIFGKIKKWFSDLKVPAFNALPQPSTRNGDRQSTKLIDWQSESSFSKGLS